MENDLKNAKILDKDYAEAIVIGAKLEQTLARSLLVEGHSYSKEEALEILGASFQEVVNSILDAIETEMDSERTIIPTELN